MRATVPVRITLLGAASALSAGTAQAEWALSPRQSKGRSGARNCTSTTMDHAMAITGTRQTRPPSPCLFGEEEPRFDIPEVVIRASVKVPLLLDPKYAAPRQRPHSVRYSASKKKAEPWRSEAVTLLSKDDS